MKIRNIILVVEFILIVIMACVSVSLLKKEFAPEPTVAEVEEVTSTIEEPIPKLELEPEPTSYEPHEQITEDGTIIPPTPVNIEPIETMQHIEEETSTESVSEEMVETEKKDVRVSEDKLNIVVFGDSIWDDKRYEDSVANLLAGYMNANVYNCAMGGTNAALVSESTQIEHWDTRSLNGMVYVATGRADADIQLAGYPANELMKSIDFNEVDYFIFAYGLNDYFCGTDVFPEDLLDMTTYVGALRHATQVMKQEYPQADYLILSPTYCQFLNLDGSIIDCTEKNFGGGNLEAYVEGTKTVAAEYNTLYVDLYNTLGINYDTAPIYLYDGIHLSSEGRLLYARKIADFLLSVEKNRV